MMLKIYIMPNLVLCSTPHDTNAHPEKVSKPKIYHTCKQWKQTNVLFEEELKWRSICFCVCLDLGVPTLMFLF